ncbi:MAG: hypothetical protein HC813_01760 [Planctomycetes bacterium]|nr:hypothetical protein [Planctomycetota bacterium]
MQSILKALEQRYRVPVDLEFAMDRGELFVLQCRPLGGERDVASAPVPPDIAPGDVIFGARRYVNPGHIDAIDYVVLIDPRDYGRIESVDRRHLVARTVGLLNDALVRSSFILMGPGRWGSKDDPAGGAGHLRGHLPRPRARRDRAGGPRVHPGALLRDALLPGSRRGAHPLPAALSGRGGGRLPRGVPAGGEERPRADPPGRGGDGGRRPRHRREGRRPGRTLALAMDAEIQRALCYLK